MAVLKVLFAGSPEPAAYMLESLLSYAFENGFEITGVLTNPPAAKGRHKNLIPTPVAQTAALKNLPIFSPEHLDKECRNTISALAPDILVCFAYGHIFGPKFMSLFKYGGINLHPSELPKYRGCSPLTAAILNQDSSTAFTVQKISKEMDTGDILAQKIRPLNGEETTGSLLKEAALEGAVLIAQILHKISKTAELPSAIPQTGKASYTKMICKDDARINWNKSAFEIDALVRAYFPEPCAWTFEKKMPLKILSGIPISEENILINKEGFLKEAKEGTVVFFAKEKGILIRCKNSFYAVTKLQRQGKKAMDYKAFINGAKDFIGSVLE